MKKLIIFIIIFVISATMAAQCGTSSTEKNTSTEQDSDSKIIVMSAWSRPSPMVAGNGAVYMTLMNEGGTADVLLSAETDVAEVVELHETKMEGDVMKMSPIDNIQVPPNGSAKLEPGGMHVMLINLKQELILGEKIELTLNFEKSGPLVIEAEVRENDEGAINHN